jgi:DNA-binding GntR family transcriptional regulator
MVPISTVTKVEQVRRAVLYQLFSGALRPGQRLIEAKLATELRVSQATVNAALQDLHSEGVVTKLLNRSTNVSRYSQQEIENLFAVRLILEPAASAAAARMLTLEGMNRLNAQLDNMRRAAKSGDLPNFCIADYAFHQEVYALSGNPFFIQACRAIAAAPFAYILCDRASALPTDYASLAEDHQLIMSALQDGPETAERVTRELILTWQSHSMAALASPPSSAQTTTTVLTGAAG